MYAYENITLYITTCVISSVLVWVFNIVYEIVTPFEKKRNIVYYSEIYTYITDFPSSFFIEVTVGCCCHLHSYGNLQ